MKKQGFTLIELLAVIVILAIIALIAVPIVFNIISDVKNKANERSIDLYAKAIENAVARTQLQQKVPNGIYTSSSDGKKLMKADTTLNIETNGNEVSCTTIVIDENFKVNLGNCKIAGKNINYTYGKIEETSQDCFEINDSGAITSYLCEDTVKEVIIPKTINGITVTSIGAAAFVGNQLIGVVIPSSVTTISDSAFRLNQITNVEIPSSITSIGLYAFANNKLKNIVIPNSVTSIGNHTFYRNQLKSIEIPSSVTSIGDNAFSLNQIINVEIPNSVTSIGIAAFANNKLKNIVIPNSVTSIGNNAFGNNQLTSVEIPSSVTSIGNNAFNANQLTSVIIKNNSGNVSIGSNAFTCSSTGFDNTKVTWQP